MDQVRQAGADVILGNTYHLMLRPGAERVGRLGGLHRFMRWERPILTDSGGFQVMSLAKISKVTEESVTFQSHIDGSKHKLTPERSVQIQADLLGSDIVMQLDECVAWPASEGRAAEALRLSDSLGPRAARQAFGEREGCRSCSASQQGSTFEALRREFGRAAGRRPAMTATPSAAWRWARGMRPACDVLDYASAEGQRPTGRATWMGAGKPVDLVEAVARGVDMFDCVLPTRAGRHGQAWTLAGAINLKNARFAEDDEPLDAAIDCPASRDYSKAYLHHLIKSPMKSLGQVLLLQAQHRLLSGPDRRHARGASSAGGSRRSVGRSRRGPRRPALSGYTPPRSAWRPGQAATGPGPCPPPARRRATPRPGGTSIR